MSQVRVNWFWEYYDVINERLRKCPEFSQYSIHLLLYIQRAVFIPHHSYIKMFLPSVWRHGELFLVSYHNVPLMEKPSSVHCQYILAASDCAYYISLQRKWIGISGWDFVECSDVHNYSGFVIWYFLWPNMYCLPYHKNWRSKQGWLFSPVHFSLLVEPVKFFINNRSVFSSQRICPLSYLLVIPAFFEWYG